jgi:adenine-specific DNA-methyltransferase
VRVSSEVSAEKLRGGFYTPPRLVAHAVERLTQLVGPQPGLRVLEPSVGDGAFIPGIEASGLAVSEFIGVEILASEAAKASSRLDTSALSGRVINMSTLEWSLKQQTPSFDAVIGNLPFVRFQFVSDRDRADADQHASDLAVTIGGVSNLWLPMLLASLRQIRVGGTFVLVLPAECLTGVSAGSARKWLLQHVAELRCDLYPAGSFPGALQEVVLLSGRMASGSRPSPGLTVALHSHLHSCDTFLDSNAIETQHSILAGVGSWTRYLLNPIHIHALEEFENLPDVHALGAIAKFDVATVTGANAFFSFTAERVKQYRLDPWMRPLLPRSRYAPGLVYNQDDFDRMVDEDVPSYIFDASLHSTDRSHHKGLDSFLMAGEVRGLHERFKCRIRSPWWAIPGIRRGELFLSKRCHRYPRMIVNETAAITTDTIYRGRMLKEGPRSACILVAGFHNSGTLLSAEIEGRNFGGGVLELVPSEVSRLRVPFSDGMGDELIRLDKISRESSTPSGSDEWNDALRHETDLLLRKSGIGVTAIMLDALADGRSLLLNRRLDRSMVERAGDL